MIKTEHQPADRRTRMVDFPFHPAAVAIYAVLVLFVLNVDQVRPAVAIRSLVTALVFSLILWGILGLILRDWRRGAILATILLGLFFSYGHVYHAFEGNEALKWVLGRHRVWVVIYSGLALLAVWGVSWKLRNVLQVTRLLNLMCFVLLLFPILQWAAFGLAQARLEPPERAASPGSAGLQADETAPDVYYIVLDGYSREDVLAGRFEFDNSGFTLALRELGFYVADCSQTNYTQTALSMASALNFSYLDELGTWEQTSDLYEVIQQNTTTRLFAEMGYTTVAFETGYYWLNLETVDIYYSAAHRAVNPGEARLKVNAFEAMLIRESAGLLFTDLLAKLPGGIQPDMEYPNQLHADQILYAFEKLPQLPLEVASPKFVYAHIVAPHSPIVFGPNGERVSIPEGIDDRSWQRAYTDEIQYVNQRVLEVVEELISVSAREPVIILQADHGAMISDQENHVEILNAYFLPGDGEADLYASISPVNTFRLIFNRYFAGEYPLVEDVSLRSLYNSPFKFDQINSECP